MKTQTTQKQGIFKGYWGTISEINFMNGTANFSRFGTWTPERVKMSDLTITR